MTANFNYDVNNDPFHSWEGNFSQSSEVPLLLFFPADNDWWQGTFSGTQLNWSLVGNTAGFGSIGSNPFWAGNFTATNETSILFFSPPDNHWWLGSVSGTQLNWTLAGTSGFGNISSDHFWVGNFSGTGKSSLLFFNPGDNHWWLGTFSGNQLNWTLADTSGFGNISSNPFWTGDFTASGKTEILFFNPGDSHWWLGAFSGNQLNWTLAGTTGFGNISKDPFWTGDFTAPGKTEILFYSPGDSNWWLGTFSGNQLNWTLAGNTAGFGNISSLHFWTGDFTASGKTEILFYSPGDSNWWLGTFSGNQLNWTLVGNTAGFGNVSACPFWAGAFTGGSKADIMFYHHSDGHWWLGTFSGTQLNWALAASTPYTPPPPPPGGGGNGDDDDDDDDDDGLKHPPTKSGSTTH